MTFSVILPALFRGRKITQPGWEGYWEWDAEKDTIMMHYPNDVVVNIRENQNMQTVLLHIASSEWELASPMNVSILAKTEKFNIHIALMMCMDGKLVRRAYWASETFVFKGPDDNPCIHLSDGSSTNYVATTEDMVSNDWELYDE